MVKKRVKKPRVLVVDANNLLIRCIMASALEDLQSDGEFTGGIYGALRTLASVVGHGLCEPARVIACFDNGVPPKRLELLPDYKAKRKERREMLEEEDKERAFRQIRQSFDIWPSLGVTCLSYRQREADDVVAAVARLAVAEGWHPIVYSGDRDLWQCVKCGAWIWDSRVAAKRAATPWVTPESFEEDAGVSVGLYVLYRALCGDSSDSIEGAKGVGPKRAQGILADLVETRPTAVNLTPSGQLLALKLLIEARAGKKKLRAFENAILDGYDHLCRVIPAIDLSRSFGGTKGLRRRLAEPTDLDEDEFLRHCKQLSFRSILNDPETIIGPFRRVQQRRDLALRSATRTV